MKIRTPKSLNEVEASKPFTVLEKGKYPVRVMNITEGTSLAGNTKVDFELEVINHPTYSGRKLFGGITPGSEAALPFVRAALEAFGVSWDDEGFVPNHFIGKTALAVVDVDVKDPNKPRNTVRTYQKA